MLDNYYKRMIYPFAINLVEGYLEINGYEKAIDICEFNESDLAKFAAILLTENPGDMSEVVWNDSLYSFLIVAIRTEDMEDKIIYAEKTISYVIKHYEARMQSILEEVRAEIVSDFYESNGKKYIVDQQNGEGRWV